MSRTQRRSKFPLFSRCRGDVALHTPLPLKKDPVAPVLPPLCHCVAGKFVAKTDRATRGYSSYTHTNRATLRHYVEARSTFLGTFLSTLFV